MNTYTYSDSENGYHVENFKKLSEIISHIELRTHTGMFGTIYQNDIELLNFIDDGAGIEFEKIEIN